MFVLLNSFDEMWPERTRYSFSYCTSLFNFFTLSGHDSGVMRRCVVPNRDTHADICCVWLATTGLHYCNESCFCYCFLWSATFPMPPRSKLSTVVSCCVCYSSLYLRGLNTRIYIITIIYMLCQTVLFINGICYGVPPPSHTAPQGTTRHCFPSYTGYVSSGKRESNNDSQYCTTVWR